MSIPHVHTEQCLPNCTRRVEVDARQPTKTDSYRIVVGHYGKRPWDRPIPRWWPFAFHAYKAVIQLLATLGILWVVNKLGWKVGP